MTISRRELLAGTAAVAAAAGMPGAASAQAKRNVLKVVPHANLQVIDPIWTTGYISRNHGYMIYDTLFALDDGLKPRPQMAESVEISSDNTKYTIRLRDGLAWHDGTAVTAEDCVASLGRWGKRDGMGQRLMAVTDKLEADGAKTIVLTLKRPYGVVLDSIGKISSNVAFMMPKRVADTPADRQIEDTTGSGPFMFNRANWKPGNLAVYEKFKAYVPRKEPVSAAAGGKIAKVDRVEWYTMDANTAMNALMAGEIDYWEQVTPDLIEVLKRAPGVKVENLDPTGNMGWARFNHMVAPTNNPLVRRAIMKAISQEEVLKTAIGNPEYYKVCKSIYPCGTPLESSSGFFDYNQAEARTLLQQSGYKGEEFVILQPTDHPVLNPFSQVIAEKLRAIGINVKLQAMDWSTVLQRRASKETTDKGGWNMFCTWWIGGDTVNPLTGVGFGATGERGWFGWAQDDEAVKLQDAYANAANADEAKKIAHAFQARLYEIGHYVNLGQFFVPVGYRDNVKGMIRSPVQFFWNMEA
jgi:peptide/nickel transport system substrate-binding protein